MDKLEKALDKARRQREAKLGGTAPHTGSLSQGYGAPTTYTSPLPLAPLPGSAAEAIPLAESRLETHRVLAHRLRSAEADIFRILRTQVLQIMGKGDLRTLAITSPRYGDGKTTVALNLAVSIALDLKQTVLLVDLDLRKPSVGPILGLESEVGLTDYLLNNVPLPDCMARLPFERLSVLPAGRALDNSSEVLGSPRMAALAHEMKSRYHDRLVIYDMPPVLAQDDPIAFLPHVDATLMVVRDGVTKTRDLKTCLERLAGANIIGTVLNHSTDR